MKNSIPFWVILLLLWSIGGSLLLNSFCCGIPGTGFTVMDGNTTVAGSAQNLVFGFGGPTPEVPDPAQQALQKTVDYLKDNPSKVLFLTGSFLDSEKQPNLGFARAESVEEHLQEMGLSRDRMIVNGRMDNKLIVEDDKVYNGMGFTIGDIPYYNLNIEDGDAFSATANKNLIFPHSQFNYETPLSEDLLAAFGKLKTYMEEHPDRSLIITGLYHTDEENTSMLPNLGLARANQIKNILQDMGIAASRIQTQSKEMDNLIFPGNQLYGGSLYSFDATPDAYNEEEKIAAVEEELKIESIKLYFETNVSSLNLSSEQRAYFGKLINYLDNKPSAKVNVVGHTDNKGTSSYNRRLSTDRAGFIKKYLVNNGLNANQIITSGKGENEPIESNNTEAGRGKNRRVEVFIK